jgi:hypothetical protein
MLFHGTYGESFSAYRRLIPVSGKIKCSWDNQIACRRLTAGALFLLASWGEIKIRSPGLRTARRLNHFADFGIQPRAR